MKKVFALAFLPVIIASFAMSSQVLADSSSQGNSVSGSAIISPIPPEPIIPLTGTGFVQFNNLTVQSVSSTNIPAEIVVSGNPLPNNCLKFQSESDSNGAAIACPGSPSYRIEVGSSTQLMLRDRTQASLSNISQGDQINVFGFYNTDGSIQAFLVRDISKPAVTETVQLNNVILVSISASGTPATLAVTQQMGNPCFGFENNTATSKVCPLGVSSFSVNPSTANVAAPQSMAPVWNMLRKYVVNVDSRTIILDRNRTQLSLANLSAGDTLNVYGETSDNGQTITADIIRDLSIPALPPTPTIFHGTVTQVNSDGSFVIQTGNGQTYTVSGPITVGASVTVTGLLTSSTISQVSQLSIGNSATTPPLPMMRINGGDNGNSGSGSSSGPINY